MKQERHLNKVNGEIDIYPLTVIKDRYTGCYSGAIFTAWNLNHWELPDGVDDGDIPCCEFWEHADDDYLIGRGATAEDAISDLTDKIKQYRQP